MTTVETGAGLRAGTTRGVEVSFSRYRMEGLPGVDRDGARLIDPTTGNVVAVIEGIGAGWAIQIHPSGEKLGTAGPDEELGDAVKRAEAAIDAGTQAAEEPRCPSCGEPLALIAAGMVGHCDPVCIARAEYVAGLRALADLLDRNPELSLPFAGRMTPMSIYTRGDARAELATWARAIPGRKTKDPDGDWLRLGFHLHGMEIRVSAPRGEVCERVVVGTREVVEEVPDPDALAAVPTVTVTKTVEDVDWICRPLLDDARVGAFR